MGLGYINMEIFDSKMNRLHSNKLIQYTDGLENGRMKLTSPKFLVYLGKITVHGGFWDEESSGMGNRRLLNFKSPESGPPLSSPWDHPLKAHLSTFEPSSLTPSHHSL